MKPVLFALTLAFAPVGAGADVISDIVDGHILPRIDALASETQTLAEVAAQDCDPASEALRTAYGAAFDAWVSASHLRFGPTEVDDRAFALAFWPDSRGATPKTLNALITDQDPIAASPADYAQVSIAARGFYAMEFLIYDDALSTAGDPAYHCQLLRTVGADMAQTTARIRDDWHNSYAAIMQTPSDTDVYRSEEEVLQEMLKAASAGLQFTSDTRLGRPLGTFDRPRPARSEARRSGRSARHVMLSLASLHDLALRLAGDDSALVADLDAEFDTAQQRLAALEDPVFASVADPQSRFKVEVVQQAVDDIRDTVGTQLGPKLGVDAGFNSMDGD